MGRGERAGDTHDGGGKEMIDRLSNKYQGKDYPAEWMAPGEVGSPAGSTRAVVDATGFEG